VPPEGDDVRGDVEIVRGGRSHDRMFGTGADEELYGGAGDDELSGQGGYDLVDGGDGGDYLMVGYSEFGNRIFCGGGFDVFEGGDIDRATGCEERRSRPG
jgi:Ca2+-binding RTX toxin-like protein